VAFEISRIIHQKARRSISIWIHFKGRSAVKDKPVEIIKKKGGLFEKSNPTKQKKVNYLRFHLVTSFAPEESFV